MDMCWLSAVFSFCNLPVRMVRERDRGSNRAKREAMEILPDSEIVLTQPNLYWHRYL